MFAAYGDAREYVAMPPERAGFVLVRLAPGADPIAARDWLRARLPDVDTWTRDEFSARSRLFWLVQTGAGGALSLAALLGFAIGLVVVAQTIYGLTAEAVEEYATLRAMGATEGYVRAVVRTQSLACGAGGGIVGLLLVAPFEGLARGLVTWIDVPSWMYGLVAVALCLMCLGRGADRGAAGADGGSGAGVPCVRPFPCGDCGWPSASARRAWRPCAAWMLPSKAGR